MPVYLLHGFRWPRPLVRIHIILQNLDDAAAEWLVAPNTSAVLLDNFHRLYPDAMGYLPGLRFVEQYDPNDTSANATSQPYAYVADMVQEIKLGVDIDDIRGKGVEQNRWAGMMELRDKLAPEEKVAWYVVVCGDEERTAPQVLGRMEMAPTNGLYSGSESEGRQIDHHHNSDFEVSLVIVLMWLPNLLAEHITEQKGRQAFAR